MLMTPEQAREEQIFDGKVDMVIQTFGTVFGKLEMGVVFQAVATWVGMLICNTLSTPLARRECASRFQAQLERAITENETSTLQ